MNRDLFELRFRKLRCAFVVVAALLLPAGSSRAEVLAPSIETTNEVSGVRILEPGKWGTIRSVVANRSASESLGLIAVQFPSDPLRQFGSRVWTPAWSIREVQTPVLLGSQPEQATSIELATRLFGQDGVQRGKQASAQTPITRGRFESAIITPGEESEAQPLVAALRKAAGLKPTTFLLNPRKLPNTAAGYEAIDSVFVAGSDLVLDPLRSDALVAFVERGGRLWILLDSADQPRLQELLGDRWDLAVLDSVEVTNFMLKGPSGETEQNLDHGVQLARVVAPGFEVLHTVQGNPAALRKAIGRGQLVVTTLGVRGWLDSAGGATAALGDLQAFVAPAEDSRALAASDTKLFDVHIGREIGHEVLGRGAVASIFGVAVAALLGAALWASRGRRLELAAPVAALLAIMSGGVLIGLGSASQSKTASTAASAQLVIYADVPDRAEVLTRTSVYRSPEDGKLQSPVRTSQGGTVVPDRAGSGALEQMIWTDPESLEILGLDLPPGAGVQLTSHASINGLGSARATIGVDKAGIRGALSMRSGTMRDQPVLVTPRGLQMLSLDHDGMLRQKVANALGSETLQSEEQLARSQVLRDLLGKAWYPVKPMILVWADLVETGVQLPVPELGSSLRAIPVAFESPPIGEEVLIPASLVAAEPLRGNVGNRKSGAVYDPIKRTWLGEVHQPMLVVMQYRIPAEFGRIDIQSAELTLDLRAPGCRFDVVVVRDGSLRVVGGGVNPSGRTAVDLVGDNAPEMDAEGRMLVGIEVHGNESMADGPGWSLQRMDLSIRGRTR